MNMPEELKQYKQWVCYRLEPDPEGKKPRKVPVNPVTGKRAMVNTPSTWSDFETAEEAVSKYHLAGLGFVLTAEDDFVVIDIDHCFDAETKCLNDIAKDIISRQDTFMEYSPSGDGLHLWYRGTKPKGSCKNTKAGVEMYDHSRYMTVTGRHVEGSSSRITSHADSVLQEIHDAFFKKPGKTSRKKTTGNHGSLSDEDLLQLAQKAANGKAFSDLWEGKWEGSYASQSEADMALAAKLAFWTGKNEQQMDRLFRSSGLYRDKWDERHYANGNTYGQETIRRAVQQTTVTYQAENDVAAPIFPYEGRYFRAKGENIYPITNFTIKPVEMIVAEEETQLTVDFVTVHGEVFREQMLTTHFDSQIKFKNLLNSKTISLSFLGTDRDLELLKQYLSELSWIRKTGVKATGIYDHNGKMIFACEKGSVDAAGSSIPDILQMQRHVGIRSDILMAEILDPQQLMAVGQLILGYNEPEKTISILGWSAGCFLKEHLRLLGIKFPLLFLIGEAGSGKSTTLEQLILPIFSCDHVIAATQVTPFTLMKASASSNLFPLSLDEFKPSKMDRLKINTLYNHFRDSYDGHDGIRGRSDQSMVTYHLLAPIIIAGEESADEAAIRERSIELLFSKKDLKWNEYQSVCQRISDNEGILKSLGRTLLAAALNVEKAEARDWYTEGMNSFGNLPSRILNNLSCCYAGLKLVEVLCTNAGLRWKDVFHIGFQPCVRYLEAGAKEYLLDGRDSNASIVEQTFEVMARMNLNPLTDYYLDPKTQRLYLRLSKVYDKYTKYRKDYAVTGEILPYTQFRKQLMHSDLFLEANVQKKINGMNTKCWVIDYQKMLEHGLDVSGFETSIEDLMSQQWADVK